MNEARFFLFFLYLYEIHNLECEGMTILADPREEFRWQSLQDEENEVEDTSDHVIYSQYQQPSLTAHALAGYSVLLRGMKLVVDDRISCKLRQ